MSAAGEYMLHVQLGYAKSSVFLIRYWIKHKVACYKSLNAKLAVSTSWELGVILFKSIMKIDFYRFNGLPLICVSSSACASSFWYQSDTT